MIQFAALLDRLLFSPARTSKLRLLQEYFGTTPDPDRGWALAALTGGLSFVACKPARVRSLVLRKVDPGLFAWSYDCVGDLAETVALIWPGDGTGGTPPTLATVVTVLGATHRGAVETVLERWLDSLDPTGRWALLKLVTGGLRVGVSRRLAQTALAQWGNVEIGAIEELWHGLDPPYGALFDWLRGGERPVLRDAANFLPLMLATPLDADELGTLVPSDFIAEWKWDGIRVQLSARGTTRRVYSRNGDDISLAFPEVQAAVPDDVVLDGELLVGSDGIAASFNELQQRLGRKAPGRALIERYPAFVRLYDALRLDGTDLRDRPLVERRRALDAWYARAPRRGLDLSPLIPFDDWASLEALRAGARALGIEGLMLKRAASPYLAGRPKGHWYKWKRGALTLDCVLLYAQRGHGKRSSFYSDYTFGAWSGAELVPVGKAYSGYTDDELAALDRWIRAHTVRKYGPVRAVEPTLVFELAFDSVHSSSRHKSGLAMRFPRVHRIRWDKPAAEADRVETLARMMEGALSD